MTLKIKTILNSLGALQELQTLNLVGSVSHDITRLIRKLQPELEIYDIERNKLVEKLTEELKNLAEDDEDKEKKQQEINEKFQTELAEIEEKELDIKFRKIDGRVLLNLNHTPRMTILLDWLIDLPEETEDADESNI